MNFPLPSLPDLPPAYPSQPYPQHAEYQNFPPAQRSFGPYRVDQLSVPTSTWQAQTFCGPAATTQHHVQQPFGPRILCPSDAPFETGSAGYSQPTSTPNSTVLASHAPPVGPQERTRKRKAPTLRAADWEPYKKRILDLHVEQDIPLPKVKQMIQNECGFEAEVRQYRSCITRWGKDKNVKLEEMQAIVRKNQKRKLIEPHKRGLVFEVRGNEVDRQKIERWMKRHNASESFLYAPSPAASTPSAVDCHTAPGSPAPTTITVYPPASSPDVMDSTKQSSETQSTSLLLTGILRSTTDNIPEHNSVPKPQFFPSLQLNFIYSLSDPESVMNRSVQISYKKDEEERFLSELVIADLAIPGNPWEILRTLHDLGKVLLDQGRYYTAADVVSKQVEGHRSRLGNNSDDVKIVNALSLLCVILFCSGSYTQAESLARRVLIDISMHGRDNQSTWATIAALGNLGHAMQKQYKLEEAESVYRQAMEEAEKLSGPKHRATMMAARDLASVLQAQHNYEEAEAILIKTLVLSREVLGLEDSDTLKYSRDLAGVLSCQERYKEAEEMQRQMVALAKMAFGPENRETIRNMAHLGFLLWEQDRCEEAEVVDRETLVLHKKILGREHPVTLSAMASLGHTFGKQGKFEEAEAVFRETLALRKKMLGHEHPETMDSMEDLEYALRKRGKLEEAETVFREALALRRKVLGPKHLDTLGGVHRLRKVLEQQGRFEEASSL